MVKLSVVWMQLIDTGIFYSTVQTRHFLNAVPTLAGRIPFAYTLSGIIHRS